MTRQYYDLHTSLKFLEANRALLDFHLVLSFSTPFLKDTWLVILLVLLQLRDDHWYEVLASVFSPHSSHLAHDAVHDQGNAVDD